MIPVSSLLDKLIAFPCCMTYNIHVKFSHLCSYQPLEFVGKKQKNCKFSIFPKIHKPNIFVNNFKSMRS